MNPDLIALMRKCIGRINGDSSQFQLLSSTTSPEDIELNKNYFGFPAKMICRTNGTVAVWVEIHHQTYRSLSNDKRAIGKNLGTDCPYFWIMTPKPELKDLHNGPMDNCPLPEIFDVQDAVEAGNLVAASIKKSLPISKITATIEIVAAEYANVAELRQYIQNALDKINLNAGAELFFKLLAADYNTSECITADFEVSSSVPNKPHLMGTLFKQGTFADSMGLDLSDYSEYSNDILVIYETSIADPLLIWDATENVMIIQESDLDTSKQTTQMERIRNAVSVLLEPASVSLLNMVIQPYSKIFYRVLNWISKTVTTEPLLQITAEIREDLTGSDFPYPQIGDTVEFSSDKLTDKGPASGTVKNINGETKVVTVTVDDESGDPADDVDIQWPPAIIDQIDNLWIVE